MRFFEKSPNAAVEPELTNDSLTLIGAIDGVIPKPSVISDASYVAGPKTMISRLTNPKAISVNTTISLLTLLVERDLAPDSCSDIDCSL